MIMISRLLTSSVMTSLFWGFGGVIGCVFFIYFICDAEDGTQCPVQARQVLYQ